MNNSCKLERHINCLQYSSHCSLCISHWFLASVISRQFTIQMRRMFLLNWHHFMFQRIVQEMICSTYFTYRLIWQTSQYRRGTGVSHRWHRMTSLMLCKDNMALQITHIPLKFSLKIYWINTFNSVHLICKIETWLQA